MFRPMVLRVALPVVVFAASVAAVGRPPDPPCVVAANWVKSHKEALPTTLAAFSKFDLWHRKAIYNALPRSARLALWHSQFRYYASSAQLTPAQQALVTQLDAVIDDYVDVDAVSAKAFDSLYTPRAKQILGDRLASEVIASLGVNTPEQIAAIGAQNTQIPPCGCSGTSDWCDVGGTGPHQKCKTGGCQQYSGCGTLWDYTCDGQCMAIQQ